MMNLNKCLKCLQLMTLVAMFALITSTTFSGAVAAQGESDAQAAELAKKLSNPLASMISVPFQFNWEHGLGYNDDGRRFLMNFQPVMPFQLNPEWNLIARVIAPFIAQPVLFEDGSPTFGMGDIVVSGFFSPNKPGFTWGVGPVISLPTTSDPLLGSGKYSLGPTLVMLAQKGPWTYGALANQLWSVGGDKGRADVNQTLLQPFLAYGKQGWTLTVNAEASANWKASDGNEWTVPIFLGVSKVTSLGGRPISLQAGPRFYVESPEGGPEWGFRVGLTLIIPGK
jgi:hypothetical protein